VCNIVSPAHSVWKLARLPSKRSRGGNTDCCGEHRLWGRVGGERAGERWGEPLRAGPGAAGDAPGPAPSARNVSIPSACGQGSIKGAAEAGRDRQAGHRHHHTPTWPTTRPACHARRDALQDRLRLGWVPTETQPPDSTRGKMLSNAHAELQPPDRPTRMYAPDTTLPAAAPAALTLAVTEGFGGCRILSKSA
jgi:hypothetical protein